MSIELKIKFCSLAEEARIIRRMERRALKAIRRKPHMTKPDHPWYLKVKEHRRGTVRWHARHTHLARMFLKGTPYDKVESKCRIRPNWDTIWKMVEKYGQIADPAHFKLWVGNH